MKSNFPQLEGAKSPFTAVPIGEVNGLPAFARVMERFEGQRHVHATSDEMFIVLKGIVYLDFDSNSVMLQSGEYYIVPAGVAHKSRVPDRAELIVVGGKV